MMKRFFAYTRGAKIALAVFVLFYVVVGTWLLIYQEKLIYAPSIQDFDNCPAFSAAEKIRFGKTRGYYKEIGDKLAVLYHGNAGSACDRDYWAAVFTKHGYSFLILEYEGYSNDTVPPTHNGLKENVDDVVSFIASSRFNEILVAGESIGSGPASIHAALYPPQKLLLLTPFSSIRDMAQRVYWYFPASFMVNNAFDNLNTLKEFSGSLLIIHGENDEVIPHNFARKLFESIGTADKKFVLVTGAKHNDIFNFSDTKSAIGEFLE